ncbi:lactose-binding lectin l-2-like [Eucyclogobius newberryi]|uniref:lactose-binding lectin l-2-like n=1 Tax=Eucyclogobius newberryi TaxID=166745 RepID=UPI003B58E9CE
MQLSRVSLVLLGVSLALASPSGLSEVKLKRGGCPMFWYSFNGHCYKYVSTHLTWADAELYCVSEGANLVSIHSPEENDFVKTLIRNFDFSQGPTWIGLSDMHKERGWMWSDGCPVDFQIWSEGEPNNYSGHEDCVEINHGVQNNWNDRPCSSTYPSVCATRKTVC